MSDAIAMDNAPKIQLFQWLRFMHMLALEINTDMRHSQGPILRALFRAGLIDTELRSTKVNKRRVLSAMVDQMRTIDPDYTPSASITKALV